MEYKYHWQKKQDERREERRPKSKPKQTKIDRRTKQGEKEDRLYSKMRLKFLEEHPVCQCNAKGCTGRATEVHHKKGRGLWYLITWTWLAVCTDCHRMIESSPEWAMEKGFTVSRLK